MEQKSKSEFYRRALNRVHSNIYITDLETDEIVYMNDFMKETYHIPNPEGKKCWEVVQEGKGGRCSFCKVGELLKNPEKKECEWQMYHAETGKTYMYYDALEEWNGKWYHFQESVDITDTLKLSLDATIDELTTILNRQAGRKLLGETLRDLKKGESFIVCLYDMNGLKWVNDTHGHMEGDKLLRYVATFLRDHLRDPDYIFRLSGDEFIVVFPGKEMSEAERWMKEMLEKIDRDKHRIGIDYSVSFSYGLAKVRAEEHLSVSDVLSIADTQMYIQKRDYHISQGKKRFYSNAEIAHSERKEFQYSREYLFDAFAESLDGYAFIGNLKTGEFMYSPKMMAEFGLSQQVVRDASTFWGERIHPEDKALFLRSNQEIADGVTDRHAICYRAKNVEGKWVHLLCKGKMIRDQKGEPDLFAGVIYNQDDQEAAKNFSMLGRSAFYFVDEYAERNAMEFGANILNFVNRNIPGGIVATYDNDTFTIACFNQALVEYTGGTYEELMQKTGGNFEQLIYEEDREMVKREIREQLTEKDVYEIYYRMVLSDGSLLWVYDMGRYAVNKEGKRYILSFFIDASDEMEPELGTESEGYAQKGSLCQHKEEDAKAAYKEQLNEMLARDTLFGFRFNLSQNRLESAWDETGERRIGETEHISSEEVFEGLLLTMAKEYDRKRFEKYCSPARIYEYAQRSGFTGEMEFRRMCADGAIIWVSLHMKIIVSPMTGEKILVAYARNIDRSKKRELSLRKKAEIDEISGLYNQGTMKLFMETFGLEYGEKSTESLFLLINVDDFKEVNRIGGFAAGDSLLRQIGERIRKISPPGSVAGRVSADLFAVFLYDCKTKKAAREEAENIWKRLNGQYACGRWQFDITVSAGAVHAESGRINYDIAYENVYRALETVKRSGGSRIVFYEKEKDGAQEKSGRLKEGTFVGAAGYEETKSREYEKELEELFNKGWSRMENGDYAKNVYRLFMEYVGKTYNAEEVTLFMQKTPDAPIVRKVGWNAYKKGATNQLNPERLSSLKQILTKGLPGNTVFIDGKESSGYEEMRRMYEKEELDYPVFLAGYYEEGKPRYYMLVEKYDKDAKSPILAEAVMEMIRKIEYLYEMQRKYEYVLSHDQNTGILNYDSFMHRVERVNEEALSTFGMIGVRMVDMKKYNQKYGNMKGDEALSYVANMLVDSFGEEDCYRVSRTSFIVLCEDMSYNKFLDSYQKIETKIEETYPDWIVAANVWEQQTISVEKMQGQLEEKLFVAQNRKRIYDDRAIDSTVSEVLRDMRQSMENKEFCTFLQPKMDTKTGRICGAEALIRYKDNTGRVVPPARFLPFIERAGLIRHIDLFVLHDICRMIRSWGKEGKDHFPISLNYSRATILEPGILEETNRIVDGYQIPRSKIEIEITETIGSIDGVSLKGIVEKFRKAGYQIALDDYGAEYSNVYVFYSLNLSTLKLDRRIINDIYHDEKAQIVVENIINLCKKFHITCVAEGVETKEQVEVLREMNCDMIQGYYMNKPLPESEFYQKYILENREQCK